MSKIHFVFKLFRVESFVLVPRVEILFWIFQNIGFYSHARATRLYLANKELP
jgi:hypothetical protein